MKYEVGVDLTTVFTIEVEAESKDKAIEKAYDLDGCTIIEAAIEKLQNEGYYETQFSKLD